MSRTMLSLFVGLMVPVGGCQRSADSSVVLYCAQDKEFAERVLEGFTQQTGRRVAAKFDTEATKSVSLYEELVRESARPRCDVHWNNEILATIRLQRQGLLQPYVSPSSASFPAWTKASDGTWQAFASRARVLLVNTRLVPPDDRPQSLLDLAEPKPSWKGRVAMAKPLFGTTATQAACLFEVMGPDAAKAYYQRLKDSGVQIVAGNKHAAVGVGEGAWAVCVTDTDDALDEIQAGRPVAMIFPDRAGHALWPRFGTLFIPNTLALVKDAPHPEAGRLLIDYLLSAEVEKQLAEGGGHQIPLNPQVTAQLPKELLTPGQVKAMAVDFEKAADLWAESQTWLAQVFGR